MEIQSTQNSSEKETKQLHRWMNHSGQSADDGVLSSGEKTIVG